MGKDCNLTVRIDGALKRDAEQAAAYLDITLSQVARIAFRDLVRKAKSERAREAHSGSLSGFVPGGGADQALEDRRERDLRRWEVLQRKRKASQLTKAESEELNRLRRKGFGS